MECHPEEDDDCKDEAERDDALLGLLLGEFLYRCGIGYGSLLRASLRMTEGAAEQIIDSDRQDQRGTSHSKREVVGIIAGIAQSRLSIFLNLDGCRRGKQGTDIDGHVENGETCIALVLVLRIIVEVAHHHLQVALKESCAKTYEQQGCQHHHQCCGITAKGYRE